ncbi:hypothetical protein B4134_3585 [Bacillus safensis]|nr:hypothetical protein B4134_3585 [Bacillus safensis]
MKHLTPKRQVFQRVDKPSHLVSGLRAGAHESFIRSGTRSS